MIRRHVLLVSRHDYGHLNPTIELAKNFRLTGAQVTVATNVSGFHKLKSLPSLDGFSMASFSDGHDDDINAAKIPGYVHDLRRVGSESLACLIRTFSESGNQVTLLVYTLFLPWVAMVAREVNMPSAILLIQSATCFSIYNHFCNRRDGIVVVNKDIETSISLQLPGVPLLKWCDFPTFVLPTSPYFSDMVSVCQDHLKFLEEDPNPRVLVNTMNGLEADSIQSIANAVVVGPLVSSSFTGDQGLYFQWLDSKPENSVIYVSFGSTAVLSRGQKEELLRGLMESCRPFLLVLRDDGEEEDEEIKELKEKIGDDGLVVGWCSQTEVLRHGAVGCFVTHCGWNSTLESMVAGVAVVACPQFADQTTNAKMVEEVWGNGVRAVVDEKMVVSREEIKRCLEVVMGGGDTAEEIKKCVEKWKKVAMESVKDGGSSKINLKLFLESIS
ncbi:UDP-glycosyltransferase 75C1 [Lactuca sativa]|uniref:UDP-glycosyltransferase 75C1 n=1 Tax=Lactuca sativa TaxID=4236 RepID=UPI000CB69220|nr:UDP-glycosyltransferase 75C1 [Lactuca sativa]